MAMNLQDKVKIENMLVEAMDELLGEIDSEVQNHPYWNDDTAALMASAAMLIVRACDLPKEEAG